MTNEVFNAATNAVSTVASPVVSSSSPNMSDWVFLALSLAFCGLIFLVMYLGRSKDNSDYEGEEY